MAAGGVMIHGSMQPISLVAINARYSHPSLGLRYLLANLGALRSRAVLREFSLQDAPAAISRAILSEAPALVALGVYIWNRTEVEDVVGRLREARPDLPIVLGGPEIAYDTESALAKAATCVLCGEPDLAFAGVCEALLRGQTLSAVIRPELPDLAAVALPYDEYTDADLAHRTLYVETSRGCHGACEFCISSITPGVRCFDLARTLPALQRLLERGASRFKFVDRSFTLDTDHTGAVLDFFLERWRPGLRLHLEMTPGRLPVELGRRLLQFPPGGLHIEVGIQTFTPEVARRVRRPMDPETVEAFLRFLIHEARADVHADLIAGLPGETPASFQAGVDRLVALGPSEMQVGILKRLHGTAIARHAADGALRFRDTPPYDVLSTRDMDEVCLDGIRRFAMHWDRVINRHWLPRTAPRIWQGQPSPWAAFDEFSRLVAARLGLHGFGLDALIALMLEFLTSVRGQPAPEVRRLLREDYSARGRRGPLPHFLRD